MLFLTCFRFESFEKWVNIREHESLPNAPKTPDAVGDVKDAPDEFHLS
jgi:hypothetical protein